MMLFVLLVLLCVIGVSGYKFIRILKNKMQEDLIGWLIVMWLMTFLFFMILFKLHKIGYWS